MDRKPDHFYEAPGRSLYDDLDSRFGRPEAGRSAKARITPQNEEPSRFQLSPCFIWWSQTGSNR